MILRALQKSFAVKYLNCKKKCNKKVLSSQNSYSTSKEKYGLLARRCSRVQEITSSIEHKRRMENEVFKVLKVKNTQSHIAIHFKVVNSKDK